MSADSVFQATFVYEAQQEDELNMQAGDKVRVLNNDNDSWWTVENVETRKKGLVPSNFLQPVSSSNGSPTKNNEGPVLAKVIREYEPQNSDELALWVNGIVTVLDQSVADGWWKGDLNGKVGVFPANHVKPVDAAEELESSDTTADAKPGKNSFKLAAYGVKQGGIGSILAGGMSLRKKSGPGRTSIAEEEHAPSPPPAGAGQPQHVQPTTSTDKPSGQSSPKKGLVLHDYEPENTDELKLMRGEYVTVTDKMDDQGWWAGTNEAGASGVFPSNFVQVLEEQRPPPRRTRPPTIKTDTPSSQPSENPLSPNSMARPPPVPVATRPTTLLSNRSSESSSSQSNNPAPPPARPVTSPPLPTRRPPSAAAEPPKRTHKPRTPSIPLVSPDLPPIASKSHEHPTAASAAHEPAAPARPSRPIPTPGDGVTSPHASTAERRSVDVDHNRPPIPMAKPPKMFGAKQPGGPVPPPRTSSAGSRPASQAAAPPSVPIASPRELSLPGEPTNLKSSTGGNSDAPLSPPPMPKRSMPMPPPSPSSTARNDNSLSQRSPDENNDADDGIDDIAVDPNISKLLHREIEKIRGEFESLLQIERVERSRLEQEIRELKERRS
ncbi:SH3 domain-containing protein [Zychaea mexicana]|uniref:SH3 domain-containing protein n=1 Tax=Zychaea mexicana TaxID=64656 RepID=UPI0022FF1A48|nr:SH3 domain-containing protein [Zychaea mexicana]KAI9491339.1 SH3 domain-containing protein [Zychaea mexicana]